ncbi:MAG: hypothetical protein RMJ06_00090 [Nitrososphaerota archaeon]|nr:hypothetical protein [Nitrososphaerota archaeon]
MRVSYVVGTLSTIVFALLLLYAVSDNPPLYDYWGMNLRRLIPFDLGTITYTIGEYVWVNLFPALIGVLIAVLTLIIGISMLLRSD